MTDYRVSKPSSVREPNNAVERTAPSGRFSPCVHQCMGAAAHRERYTPSVEK